MHKIEKLKLEQQEKHAKRAIDKSRPYNPKEEPIFAQWARANKDKIKLIFR